MNRSINYVHLAALASLFLCVLLPGIWWIWVPAIPSVLWICTEPKTREAYFQRAMSWLGTVL